MIVPGYPHFLIVEIQQAAVFVDPADTDQGEVDLELVDEIDAGLADDTAVAAHIAASEQDFEIILGAEDRGDVQVVGDHLELGKIEQRPGDGFGGGADVDEQRGVIGNLAAIASAMRCFSSRI